MKLRFSILFVMLLPLFSCNLENDFYEVGRQQVFLQKPVMDEEFILDYEHPDSVIVFSWYSKRHYINYTLLFETEDTFEDAVVIDPGIAEDWKMSFVQLDSLLADLGVPKSANADLYWKVDVVDPETGWCEDVFRVKLKRFDLPEDKIAQVLPENDLVIDLNTVEGDSLEFKWGCASTIEDYRMIISLSSEFDQDSTMVYEAGPAESIRLSYSDIDGWLDENGVGANDNKRVFWKVTGTEDIYSEVADSDIRTIVFRRPPNAPVELKYLSPDEGTLIILKETEETVDFKWECDTAGLQYTFRLYDAEFDRLYEQVTDSREFSLSQIDMDQIMGDVFGMVYSQTKKFVWSVTPSDTVTFSKVKESPREIFIKRKDQIIAAASIKLTEAPAPGMAYDLTDLDENAGVVDLAWEYDNANVVFEWECSISDNMMNSVKINLGDVRNATLTALQLDEALHKLGKAYLTSDIYWRLNALENSITRASTDVQNIRLTGMLRPFIDNRGPGMEEEYKVVRVGDAVWMAENLRAEVYSDGTPLGSVDAKEGVAAFKKYSNDLIQDEDIRGIYYSWPIAVRDYQNAGTSDTEIHQGVCPDGWHVSTKAEWDEAVRIYGGDASKFKSENYWQNARNNESGLNIVPAGSFWHCGTASPNNPDDKACFWTSTKANATTAYMYELFGWSNSVTPWNYVSRPFSEGDATASRLCAVRCVRDNE